MVMTVKKNNCEELQLDTKQQKVYNGPCDIISNEN